MKVYNYHPVSGEFISETAADMSPLEPGIYHVPAFATAIRPPSGKRGKARVFANGKWTHLADHRGQTFYDTDGAPVFITLLGDPADAGLTAAPPPPTLAEGQAAKLRELTLAFQDEWRWDVPFVNADGVEALFQSGDASRSRLSEVVTSMSPSSLPTDFAWIAADNRQVIMTHADLVALLAAMMDHHWKLFQRLQLAKQAVRAATELAQVDAITF